MTPFPLYTLRFQVKLHTAHFHGGEPHEFETVFGPARLVGRYEDDPPTDVQCNALKALLAARGARKFGEATRYLARYALTLSDATDVIVDFGRRDLGAPPPDALPYCGEYSVFTPRYTRPLTDFIFELSRAGDWAIVSPTDRAPAALTSPELLDHASKRWPGIVLVRSADELADLVLPGTDWSRDVDVAAYVDPLMSPGDWLAYFAQEQDRLPCIADASRLTALCGAVYQFGTARPNEDWVHNVLSRRTVSYSCGKLAVEAASQMRGVEIGMGDESLFNYFQPFFIAASRHDAVPANLTEGFMRSAFGGAIYPEAQLIIEPLREAGQWWEAVLTDYGDDEKADKRLQPWRAMIQWFQNRPELHGQAFLMIGDSPLPGANQGCAFPRIAVGITDAGSVVGFGGSVIHT